MPDDQDLARLTGELAARSASLPSDYVRGKTWMRDTLIALLDCSTVDAEKLVIGSKRAVSSVSRGIRRV